MQPPVDSRDYVRYYAAKTRLRHSSAAAIVSLINVSVDSFDWIAGSDLLEERGFAVAMLESEEGDRPLFAIELASQALADRAAQEKHRCPLCGVVAVTAHAQVSDPSAAAGRTDCPNLGKPRSEWRAV